MGAAGRAADTASGAHGRPRAIPLPLKSNVDRGRQKPKRTSLVAGWPEAAARGLSGVEGSLCTPQQTFSPPASSGLQASPGKSRDDLSAGPRHSTGKEVASVTFVPICHFLKGPAGGGGSEDRQQGSEKPPPKRGEGRQVGSRRADSSETSQVIREASGDPTSQREICSLPDAAGESSSSRSCLLWRYLSRDVPSSEAEAIYAPFHPGPGLGT